MLQQDAPRDYILATGQGHAVRDFAELAYAHPAVDTAIRWTGEGTEETGQDAAGRTVIAVDPALYRPAEAAPLIGDARRARERLGWVPEHDLGSLVDDMVSAAAGRADG